MDATNPTTRFSDRVDDYDKYRPKYPAAFFDFLQNELGLSAGRVVADVGSGTGISAGPLAERGVKMFAVEPNGPMREAAERRWGGNVNFHSVNGTAEATKLPDGSVDAVLAAQAFHWFDKPSARAEFLRVLKPGGWVALVWNDRRMAGTPFLEGYEDLLIRHGTDYKKVRHQNVDDAVLAEFFGSGGCARRSFENAQELDYAGLEGRLMSSSYVPARGAAGHVEMIADLRDLFARCSVDGKVRIEYDTRVYYGRMGEASSL